MPVYPYVCRDCKKTFELVQTVSQVGKSVACPRCKSKRVERVWSTVTVHTSKKS